MKPKTSWRVWKKGVSEFCELILVVGSANSSNSKRLVEVGQNFGVQAYLVNDWDEVDPAWLEGIRNIGVTAGASAPEHLVERIVSALHGKGFLQLEEVEMVEEDVRFSLPPELGNNGQLYSISR
jgi:4-hydroxy-3-methylbut-2-enyl diphosphate reductase